MVEQDAAAPSLDVLPPHGRDSATSIFVQKGNQAAGVGSRQVHPALGVTLSLRERRARRTIAYPIYALPL